MKKTVYIALLTFITISAAVAQEENRRVNKYNGIEETPSHKSISDLRIKIDSPSKGINKLAKVQLSALTTSIPIMEILLISFIILTLVVIQIRRKNKKELDKIKVEGERLLKERRRILEEMKNIIQKIEKNNDKITAQKTKQNIGTDKDLEKSEKKKELSTIIKNSTEEFVRELKDKKKEPIATVYYNQGVNYFEKKEYDGAIENYTKAIELDPKFASAYNNRGNAYKQKWETNNNEQDYKNSIKDYNKAIKLDPKLAEAYFNRGNAYLKKWASSNDERSLENAIKDFKEAQKLGIVWRATLIKDIFTS